MSISTATATVPTAHFIQTPLPYALDALAPHISAATLNVHYGKHHKGYVDRLNELVAGTDHVYSSLEQIMLATAGRPDQLSLFENAAQVWNHDFYWRSLRAHGGGLPAGPLRRLICNSFASVDALCKELLVAASTRFGSGWAWLVLGGDGLQVVTTGNADNPLSTHQRPLLAIDIWEHAYYLDKQNRRADYLHGVIDRLLNWDFAADNLRTA